VDEFSIQHLFADLEDPRQAHKVKHRLDDIILLAIFAVISNAQSWTEIEAFGLAKEEWLKQYLVLENSIPSHDTSSVVQIHPDISCRFIHGRRG
jgi:hypothetical protein